MKIVTDKPRLIPDFEVVGALTTEQPDWATKGVRPNTSRPVVYATASSTAEDLESDRMSEKALKQMAERFIGVTAFLNHKYQWPEDVFGTILRTHLVERDGVIDLDIEIAIEDKNPRAIQSYEMIKNGTRAGVSVGVLVLDHKTTDDTHMGRKVIEISDILPLEASLVGIPAVQRAWVQDAVKSLHRRGLLTLSCDELGCRPWLTEESDMSNITRKIWEETDTEIRYRVRDPADFQDSSFKRITLQKDEPRVYAIVGKLEGEDTMTIQALRFPLDDGWTLKDAKAWVKKHPIKKGALDEDALTDPVDLADADAQVPSDGTCADGDGGGDDADDTDDDDADDDDADDEDEDDADEDDADDEDEDEEDDEEEADAPSPGYRFALRMLCSLADELAEMEFSQKFWRLTYAFTDAVWDVIKNETGDERIAGVQSVVAEYNKLLTSLIAVLPESMDDDDEDKDAVYAGRIAMAEQMLQDVTCLLAAVGDPEGDRVPVDKDAPAGDTSTVAIAKQVADLTQRAEALDKALVAQTFRADVLQLAWDQSRAMIGEILDLPLEIKTQDGDTVSDAARDTAKRRYPELSPVVESLVRPS